MYFFDPQLYIVHFYFNTCFFLCRRIFLFMLRNRKIFNHLRLRLLAYFVTLLRFPGSLLFLTLLRYIHEGCCELTMGSGDNCFTLLDGNVPLLQNISQFLFKQLKIKNTTWPQEDADPNNSRKIVYSYLKVRTL